MAQDEAEIIERRDTLVMVLEGKNRRKRQEASHELATMARDYRDIVAEVADSLTEALELPEAQTRWQCLEALSEIAVEFPDCVLEAFDGAERALFDEGSPSMRLAAFRFLCRYGSINEGTSREAWPLMREALQCFHGDPEYRDMLICLLDFSRGNIAQEVRDALVDWTAFDRNNGKGFIRAYSKEIYSVLGRD